MWTLDVVTRCDALQELLTPAERVALSSALLHRITNDDDDGDDDGDDGDSPKQQQQPEQQQQQQVEQAPSSETVHSNHLKRWTQWKLDPAHIARLTSAAQSPTPLPPELLAADMRFFARGKRGVLYAGELKSSGAPVVVKLGAADSGGGAVDAEAKWLRAMNRMGVGARLHASGPGWVVCERLEGLHVVDFLGAATTSHASARWVLREMLCQCFAMDLMGVNKDEMTHPHRHILVHRSAAGERRCTLIDFEKCAPSPKPKNVTQLCQFLCSPRMVALLGAKGVVVDVPAVRLATRRYKQSGPHERAFSVLARVFGLY